MMRRHAGPFALMALLAAASAATAQQKSLSGQQIRDLMTGTTVAFTAPNGKTRIRMTFSAGGGAAAALTGGKIKSDTGKWTVERNRLMCIQFQRLREGKKGCFAVIRQGRAIKRYNPKTGKPAPGPEWTIVTAGPGAAKVGAPAGPVLGQKGGRAGADRPGGKDVSRYVTGAALRALVTGTTVHHVSPRSGKAVTMTWERDGTISAMSERKQVTGHWTIERERNFCMEMSIFAKGKACMLLIRNGNRIERYSAKTQKRVNGQDWEIAKLGGGTQ